MKRTSIGDCGTFEMIHIGKDVFELTQNGSVKNFSYKGQVLQSLNHKFEQGSPQLSA